MATDDRIPRRTRLGGDADPRASTLERLDMHSHDWPLPVPDAMPAVESRSPSLRRTPCHGITRSHNNTQMEHTNVHRRPAGVAAAGLPLVTWRHRLKGG